MIPLYKDSGLLVQVPGHRARADDHVAAVDDEARARRPRTALAAEPGDARCDLAGVARTAERILLPLHLPWILVLGARHRRRHLARRDRIDGDPVPAPLERQLLRQPAEPVLRDGVRDAVDDR